jgi:hypothetical protein
MRYNFPRYVPPPPEAATRTWCSEREMSKLATGGKANSAGKITPAGAAAFKAFQDMVDATGFAADRQPGVAVQVDTTVYGAFGADYKPFTTTDKKDLLDILSKKAPDMDKPSTAVDRVVKSDKGFGFMANRAIAIFGAVKGDKKRKRDE